MVRVERLVGDLRQDVDMVQTRVPTPKQDYSEELIGFVLSEFQKKSQQRINDVRVAAGELIANAIQYGNDHDPAKLINIFCLWKEGVFYFAIQDEGEGFDVNDPPFVAGKSGVPPEGGMGIAVARGKLDFLGNLDSRTVLGAVKVAVEKKPGLFRRNWFGGGRE